MTDTCPDCRRRCFTAAEWDALPDGDTVPGDACVSELHGGLDSWCDLLAAELRRAEDANLLAAARCFPPGYLAEVAAILRAGAERHGCQPHETGGDQSRADHLRHAIGHLGAAAVSSEPDPDSGRSQFAHVGARAALAWEREQAAGAGES